MNNENGTKIRKILFNEISLITGMVAITIGIVLFIVGPDAQLQQDVALIKQSIENIETNHLTHIQDDLEKVSIKTQYNEKCINEINLKLERILTILER